MEGKRNKRKQGPGFMRFYRPNFLLRSFVPDSIWTTPESGVLVTIDDGPSGRNTEAILRALREVNCTAVFFCTGKNADDNQNMVQEIKAEGHEIANHGWNHSKHIFMNRSELEKSIITTSKLLSGITGEAVTFYRPPYGLPGIYQNRILKKLKMKNVMWSLLSYDFEGNDVLSREIISEELRSDDIVVFHDNEKSSKVFPEILYYLAEVAEKKKYKFADPRCLK